MKKNMFNVIKVIAIIPVLLTTCNIGNCKAEVINNTASVNPNFYFQDNEQEYEFTTDEIVYNDIDEDVVEETYEPEDTYVEEYYYDEPVYNYTEETVSNEVMSESSNIKTEEVVTPEVEKETQVQNTNIYYNTDYAYQVLALMNQIRKENGLNELYMDNTLVQIANIRAEEITRYWSHTRPDGSNWWTLHSQYGLYGIFGENLAYGQSTPEEVIQAWMNSEGHRANIVSSDYTRIGISVYYNDGVYYWSQEFAG